MAQISTDRLDGRHDFDFFVGRWNVANRRLDQRLVGSDTWLEFPATSDAFSCLDGIGNFDQIRFDLPDGQSLTGMTVRIFNPETRLWSLHWADSHSAVLFPPVVGCFQDGVGEFCGEDIQDGVPVKVRFRWSGITPTSARWEQAMSADGGATWEWNWVMEFERVPAAGGSEPALVSEEPVQEQR